MNALAHLLQLILLGILWHWTTNLKKNSAMQWRNCLKSRNDMMEQILVLKDMDFHGLGKIMSYFSVHKMSLLMPMQTPQMLQLKRSTSMCLSVVSSTTMTQVRWSMIMHQWRILKLWHPSFLLHWIKFASCFPIQRSWSLFWLGVCG